MKDFHKIADVEAKGWGKFGVVLYTKGLIGLLLTNVLYLIDTSPGMPQNVWYILNAICISAIFVGKWITYLSFPQLKR